MASVRGITGKAKVGGLQDMINTVTSETSPGASPQLLARIVEYINRSPDRGSDKALKYMKNRFSQKHVKVQNLTLIVLETCTKRCGHMFREKLPFSDLWTELHKVATLKRKADVQIYNKILALIEDWSEAIDLPAYRSELTDLKDKAVRFPNRPNRDLSEYREGGTFNALGQPQALPPGSGSALKAEFDGPGSPPAAGSNKASPAGSRASTPYAYGGNGHFTPSRLKAPTGNVASLPDHHLEAGQAPSKLRDDLFAAKNSADLLSEMLSSITMDEAAEVKQEHVVELAGQCEAMLPRLAKLAEQVTDESNLSTTLAVHGDMEESLIKYRSLLDIANGGKMAAPPSPPADEATASSAPAPQQSFSLLDFDDGVGEETSSAPPPAAAPAAAAAPTAAKVAAPQPQPQSRNPHDLLADLFDAPAAPAQPQAPGAAPPAASGFPHQQQHPPSFAWNGVVPPEGANPFGHEEPTPSGSAAASQGFANFGDSAFSSAPSSSQAPAPAQPNFSQAPNFGGQPPQQFGSQPQFAPSPSFSQAPPSFGQEPNFGAPPAFGQQPQYGQPPQFGSQQPQFGGQQAFGPQGFGAFGEPSAFGGPPAFGPPQQGGFGAPPQFGAPPPPYGPQSGFGPPPGQPPFPGGFEAPQFGNSAPPFQTPSALPAPPQQQQPPQQPNQFGSQQAPAQAKFDPFQQQPLQKQAPPNFGGGNVKASSLSGSNPPSPRPPQPAYSGSANPFDDPPPAQSHPAPPPASVHLKLAPPAAAKAPASGAAPKPSWPPPAEADPFADLGPKWK